MAYTNSPLVDYTRISPNRSVNRKHTIDTVTIHCVVGQCSVETLGTIFARSSCQASANYGIGYDGRIGLYVEEKDRSWCTSSASNDNRAITIEVASDTYDPYAVTDAAYNKLIDLLVDICKRNDIGQLVWSTSKYERMNHLNGCNMTVHRDYANKACPGNYLYNLHGQIAAEVNARLNSEEDEDMTQEQFNQMANNWISGLASQTEGADYAKEALSWGKENELLLGDESGNQMPKSFLTREQFITVVKRFYEKLTVSFK